MSRRRRRRNQARAAALLLLVIAAVAVVAWGVQPGGPDHHLDSAAPASREEGLSRIWETQDVTAAKRVAPEILSKDLARSLDHRVSRASIRVARLGASPESFIPWAGAIAEKHPDPTVRRCAAVLLFGYRDHPAMTAPVRQLIETESSERN